MKGGDPHLHAQGAVRGKSFLSPSHFVSVCVAVFSPLSALTVRLSCMQIICVSWPKLKVTGVPASSCSFLYPPERELPSWPPGGLGGHLASRFLLRSLDLLASGVLPIKLWMRVPAASCQPPRVSCEFRLRARLAL